ncbi:N-acetylmuramoyl-L-alanine amidase [Clostridium butyricum]|uniref:N-acetylmuramoyl-L-alanine amidase n=2 Tax=Bacteria TaxID=2 RepID=UPI00325BE38D
MISAYIYDLNENYRNITELLISLKYKCSLDKPCQEVTFSIPCGIYSDAFPSIYIETGLKFELYEGEKCIFRGKTEIVTLNAGEEKLTITCYDYIRSLMKSKVTYNFQNISAFSAICQIFNDLKIPYSTGGILGGEDDSSSGNKIQINHLIKNKSAYDACMMIATEVHNQFNEYYYMYMDVSGNVNLFECDRYWSSQIIEPCSDASMQNPDGNLISLEYKEDASDIITQVALYNSKGGKVDIATGEEEADVETGGGEISNGKVIGIDMGHNNKCPGASGYLDEITENRKIGNKLIALLKKEGYSVVNCTDDDTVDSKEQLAGIMSKANSRKLDLFLSIHLNAGGGHGTSIYYNSKVDKSIVYDMIAKVADSCHFTTGEISLHDGSDGGSSFYVLRNNNNPAILLEVCFVDNINDKNSLNQDKVAEAILEAIKGGVK